MEDYYQSWRNFHDFILERYNHWYALFGLLRTICYYIGGLAIVTLIFTLLIDSSMSALITICIVLTIIAAIIILTSFAGRMLIGERMGERIRELDRRRRGIKKKKNKTTVK